MSTVPIKGYPSDIDLIVVSDKGYGINPYIETTQAAGGGHRARPGQRQAGHLPRRSFTMSIKRGQSRRATRKFETFPDLEPALKASGQSRL